MTYENDVAVGQLLNYLETHDDPRNPGHKLIDNTLFIFSSDNGAENAGKESSGYYRGRKAHIHDDYIMGPMLSLRDGDWKLIVGQELIVEGTLKHYALFNLKDNPTEDERQNLIASEQHRHLVESLSAKLLDIYHQSNH